MRTRKLAAKPGSKGSEPGLGMPGRDPSSQLSSLPALLPQASPQDGPWTPTVRVPRELPGIEHVCVPMWNASLCSELGPSKPTVCSGLMGDSTPGTTFGADMHGLVTLRCSDVSTACCPTILPYPVSPPPVESLWNFSKCLSTWLCGVPVHEL
ncbi:hypothetical protein Cadr_000017618 [Camelus dromedarius]|uniref:Uncharacterized protein n=1 Tax=Camelus dromedarius TaxID=9838 RepID=A0A5N4DGC5_CAMDR|nr:hypothetical protein Cadr_000017618 [Camelus dromedarius]